MPHVTSSELRTSWLECASLPRRRDARSCREAAGHLLHKDAAHPADGRDRYVPLVAPGSIEHRDPHRDDDHCDNEPQHDGRRPVERMVEAVERRRTRRLSRAGVLAGAPRCTDAPPGHDADGKSSRDEDGMPPLHERSMRFVRADTTRSVSRAAEGQIRRYTTLAEPLANTPKIGRCRRVPTGSGGTFCPSAAVRLS